MLTVVYIACIIGIYYAGYKFGLYSSALYMEPEEIDEFSARLSPFTRQNLAMLFENQRRILRLSMLVKSFALVILSFFAILIGQQIIYAYALNPAATMFLALMIVWILHVLFF